MLDCTVTRNEKDLFLFLCYGDQLDLCGPEIPVECNLQGWNSSWFKVSKSVTTDTIGNHMIG